MIKVLWTNEISNGQGNFETIEQANEWLAQHIANNTFGKPARWLPDFLEGAETRQVLVTEATKEETNFVYDYDENGNEIPDSGHEVITEAKEAEYVTEYLHPAEYTYEIVEETLATIKDRKIAELSAISLAKNEWISGNKAYQVANIAMGKYIGEGKKSKEDGYKAKFIARSTQLTSELDRCVALVNAAITKEEVSAINFNIV